MTNAPTAGNRPLADDTDRQDALNQIGAKWRRFSKQELSALTSNDDLIDRIVAIEGLRRYRLHVPLALCQAAASALAVVLPPSFFSPDALLGLTQDAELDHSEFSRECGYAPLSLEDGFARTFGNAAA